jgi:U2 small nuclear ribonucleoprotein A'
MLSNNQIDELNQLESLFSLKSLKCLSLIGNPVERKAFYRLYVIFRASESLRYLDFKKIKKSEREEAKQFFCSSVEGKEMLRKVTGIKDNIFVVGDFKGKENFKNLSSSSPLDPEEVKKIKTAIANATSLEEINLLERYLKTGIK